MGNAVRAGPGNELKNSLARIYLFIYLFITISGIQHMVKKKKKKSRQAMRIIRKRVEDSIHDRSPDLDAL